MNEWFPRVIIDVLVGIWKYGFLRRKLNDDWSQEFYRTHHYEVSKKLVKEDSPLPNQSPLSQSQDLL
jgi:hypothetical protein